MKLIILAAGKGTRLMPLTRNTPKSLLYLKDGKTLLETQIDRIIKSGVIDELIIVTGYRAEQIDAKIKTYNKQINIKTIYNPFYEFSNNLVSLWMAKHEMNGPFLITNGDNIFSSDVFKEIVKETGEGVVLTITDIDKFNKDDMKIIKKNENIILVSKEIEERNASGESVGLVKVSGNNFIEMIKETLEELVKKKEYINKFWLETFNILSKKAIRIKPFEIKRDDWLEFDFHIDLELAQRLLEGNN